MTSLLRHRWLRFSRPFKWLSSLPDIIRDADITPSPLYCDMKSDAAADAFHYAAIYIMKMMPLLMPCRWLRHSEIHIRQAFRHERRAASFATPPPLSPRHAVIIAIYHFSSSAAAPIASPREPPRCWFGQSFFCCRRYAATLLLPKQHTMRWLCCLIRLRYWLHNIDIDTMPYAAAAAAAILPRCQKTYADFADGDLFSRLMLAIFCCREAIDIFRHHAA